MGKTFRGVVRAAVEQSRRRANIVAQGDGKFGPWVWPQDPFKQNKSASETWDMKFKSWQLQNIELVCSWVELLKEKKKTFQFKIFPFTIWKSVLAKW